VKLRRAGTQQRPSFGATCFGSKSAKRFTGIPMLRYEHDSYSEFIDSYLSDLRVGKAEIQEHFATYFSRVLDRWLRSRLRDVTAIQDIRQETLLRVMENIGREKGLRDPYQLPQFVNRVCHNVLLEHWRKAHNTAEVSKRLETLHESPNSEQNLQEAEEALHLRNALMRIPANDRTVLTMLYFEERSRAEVSRQIGVNQRYLRVLVHRAILRLRASFISGLGQPHVCGISPRMI
jgi:RNA polymerase sigma factor (sigma-70 family)